MLDSSNIETNFDEEKIILPYSSNKTTFFNFLQRKPYNLKLQTNSPRMKIIIKIIIIIIIIKISLFKHLDKFYGRIIIQANIL